MREYATPETIAAYNQGCADTWIQCADAVKATANSISAMSKRLHELSIAVHKLRILVEGHIENGTED